jgi:hypothetical protein
MSISNKVIPREQVSVEIHLSNPSPRTVREILGPSWVKTLKKEDCYDTHSPIYYLPKDIMDELRQLPLLGWVGLDSGFEFLYSAGQWPDATEFVIFNGEWYVGLKEDIAF